MFVCFANEFIARKIINIKLCRSSTCCVCYTDLLVRYIDFFFFFYVRVGADITVLREQEVDYDADVPLKIAEVLIRKVPDDQQVSRILVKTRCFFLVVLATIGYELIIDSIFTFCLCFFCSFSTCELPSWGT